MAKELHLFDIIRRPIITEKATRISETLNQYTFEVAVTANKIQVKDAIELIFDVDVLNVNTLVMAPKHGRRGRKVFLRTSKWKKAIVTVAPGQQINLFNQ
jgi:large subunit ribosomal protein L23